ncbi:unnamed protein product [Ranitomeya imitator]|uniref:Uncharacterized protein n=1 Tax=Ranitomeya imitator TaxID=111125 RepID=A0ABN9M3H5_9NEOB|nr:unnamed protein product [Ranitomeya imitator]
MVGESGPDDEFTEEYIRKISQGEWPKIIIVADGSCGESSSLLGVNSDYVVESCNAYGANAAFERPDQRQVPTPEIRAHNLYFDLSAYGIDVSSSGKDTLNKPGFHLKIYGTFRNRYMALACPASDTKVVRFLIYTPNSSVMKNIFHQSFNAYKTDIEPRMSDLTLPRLQCSRRLFEIMLSHRRVTSAFIEGDNVVVTLEGEKLLVFSISILISPRCYLKKEKKTLDYTHPEAVPLLVSHGSGAGVLCSALLRAEDSTAVRRRRKGQRPGACALQYFVCPQEGRAKYACAGAVAEDQKRTSWKEDRRCRSGPETPIRPDQQRDRPWNVSPQGCGVNLGLRGLESSEQFIYKVAIAVDQSDVFEALAAKIKHSKQVVEEFKLHGLETSVFE